MSKLWKVLVTVALVVPMGAYVAGSLAASASDDPAPRHPITIRDPGSTPSRSPSPSSSSSSSPTDGPEVIMPGYDDLDDDHGRDGHGDDHGGRGHG
ncbi:MAG TPA: hypothetical protein VFT70_06005 [Nocardioides sp.]|nr:hypothetical protein [Nocardioides sp.]